MGEVEWSASSSETNPMLGIGRQSKRQSIGIMWGLSRPTLAWGRAVRGSMGGCAFMAMVAALRRASAHAHAGRFGLVCKKSVVQRGGDGADGVMKGRTGILLPLFTSHSSSHLQPPLHPLGPRSLCPPGEVVHWRCQIRSWCQLGKHSNH